MKRMYLYLFLMLCYCSSCVSSQKNNSQTISDDSLYASLDSIVTNYYKEQGYGLTIHLHDSCYAISEIIGLTFLEVTKKWGKPDSETCWENVGLTFYHDDMYIREVSETFRKYRDHLTIYRCFWHLDEDSMHLFIPFIKIGKERYAAGAELISEEVYMME